MAPKVMEKFQRNTPHFPIYYESATRYYVPRAWGKQHFGEPEADIVSEGTIMRDSVEFNTDFPPRDYQREIMRLFLEKGANGLICVPCGAGKTYLAIYLAIQLHRRFLIVVDKEFLMNQWKEEMERFVVGLRVGILQGTKVQVDAEKYDVTICMIQTLCKREFPDGFFDQYGFTIFDECHHLGSSFFCGALKRVQTKWMLGLSATPDREDGLSKVFEAFLGPAVFKNIQRAPDSEAVVKAVWFNSEDPVYKEIPVNWKGETVTATLLNRVAEYAPRNELILKYLKDYAKDPQRFILLLSDRISQLDWFVDELKKTSITHGYYIGGMKQSVLDHNAQNCQILLATYHIASEAFSVARLNTVVLATPRKSVTQSTGRIFRQRIEERPLAPHIIDIIDSHDIHKRRWYVRQRYYKTCQYQIQHQGKKKQEQEEDEQDEEKDEPFAIRL